MDDSFLISASPLCFGLYVRARYYSGVTHSLQEVTLSRVDCWSSLVCVCVQHKEQRMGTRFHQKKSGLLSMHLQLQAFLSLPPKSTWYTCSDGRYHRCRTSQGQSWSWLGYVSTPNTTWGVGGKGLSPLIVDVSFSSFSYPWFLLVTIHIRAQTYYLFRFLILVGQALIQVILYRHQNTQGSWYQ